MVVARQPVPVPKLIPASLYFPQQLPIMMVVLWLFMVASRSRLANMQLKGRQLGRPVSCESNSAAGRKQLSAMPDPGIYSVPLTV